VELYLQSPIHLHSVVRIFIVWYLVKHRDNFTFTCTFSSDMAEIEEFSYTYIVISDSAIRSVCSSSHVPLKK
jgi:hypothetical protein